MLPDGATVPLAANLMRVAEVELAFRFGAPLPPRDRPYAIGDVMAAVASLHPAIEIPDSRYDDFTVVGARGNAITAYVVTVPCDSPFLAPDLAA